MRALRRIERVGHRASLGFRFLDVASRDLVGSGLEVIATPLVGPGRPVDAYTTRGGNYAFAGLPGLHDYEFDNPGATLGSVSPPLERPFAIQVSDRQERFLAWGAIVSAPRPELDKLVPGPLFSSSTRPSEPSLAVVRGRVVDAAALTSHGVLEAASYARVEMTISSTSPPDVIVGFADARGEFAMFFPFPEPLRAAPTGSPALVTIPLGARSRRVTMTFHYARATQRFISSRPDGRVEVEVEQVAHHRDLSLRPEWRSVPELRSLRLQPAVAVSASAAGPPQPSLEAEIVFGEETLIRRDDGVPHVAI